MKSLMAGMIALAALVANPGSVTGQDLTDGAWTGVVTPPSGENVPVKYQVTHDEGDLAILLETPMGDFPFQDITFVEGALRFFWEPGNTVLECDLQPNDEGGYEGECTDEDGVPGTLTMVPPAPTDE
jgi:hypothetical protein